MIDFLFIVAMSIGVGLTIGFKLWYRRPKKPDHKWGFKAWGQFWKGQDTEPGLILNTLCSEKEARKLLAISKRRERKDMVLREIWIHAWPWEDVKDRNPDDDPYA